MPQDQVLADITEIVGGVTGIDQADITPETALADLGIDSLMMVEVVVAAEERFGVKIPDDEVKNLNTVGDAVKYIAANA